MMASSAAGNPNEQGSASAALDVQNLLMKQPSNPPYSTNGPSYSYQPNSTPFHHPHYLPSTTTPSPPPPYQQPPPQQQPNHHHQQPSPLSPNPNHGARLMALLNTNPSPSPSPNPNTNPPSSSMHSTPPTTSEYSSALNPRNASTPTPPPLPLPPNRKVPKGRQISGHHVIYDVDVRLPGELQPQLEVAPITKYVSDPALVVGRQIAVNSTYICYGLKLGAIRILNINTATRALLRGHNQRVTDMAFFREEVHLLASVSVDGKVCVWKIDEGPDEEGKPQITGQIIVVIHILGEGGSIHPRLCWHPHKQEYLVVGLGKHVLRIDTTKAGKGEIYSAALPPRCLVENLIDGVQLVGKHDGEVTDISMCQWMTTRIVSASTDGTVKIWEDRREQPLVVLRPYDGQPVYAAVFLTVPDCPSHINLITAGLLNREVKLWASTSEDGWLLPSDAESWQCTQILDLRSSAESRLEDAFFNQVLSLSRAGLVLLANAKRNAIYAVHIEYGQNPAATHMDYIAEFTVTMPILSLTGTSDCLSDGEHVVQVYCVQTQAIQQYALDLCQCLPPTPERKELEKSDSGVNRDFDTRSTDGLVTAEPLRPDGSSEILVSSDAPNLPMLVSSTESTLVRRYPANSGGSELPIAPNLTSGSKQSVLPPTTTASNNIQVSSPLPLSPRNSGLTSPSGSFELGLSPSVHGFDQPAFDYSINRKVDTVLSDLQRIPSWDNSLKDEKEIVQNDISIVQTPPVVFKHPTHLITPSEILSKTASSSESTLVTETMNGESKVVVSNDSEGFNVEVNVVGGDVSIDTADSDSQRGHQREKGFYSQASSLSFGMTSECCALSSEPMMETQEVDATGVTEALDQPQNAIEEQILESREDLPQKVSESATLPTVPSTNVPASKGKKQKGKISQVSGPSFPSPSPFNSTDSFSEPNSNSGVPSVEAELSQILSVNNQLLTMQKEMQKQMATMLAVPVTKEGKRLEASLIRAMEKANRANTDALWARIQEENAKREKINQERLHQITSSISNCLNKELPSMLERTLKKELAALGQAIARLVTPAVEKCISLSITESFQRGVGDKAVTQLEKSVNSKLEVTVVRQIQAQFQTSGKQALQEALRSTMEVSAIPAFEMSCKAMFEQVDNVFQKGMIEHMAATKQQFDATHSPMALALREAISSASSMAQTLTGELADGQRKILALAAAGANSKAVNPLVTQLSSRSVGGVHDIATPIQHVEAPLDPTKELSRLISERQFGEAFTGALQRSDVTIVSWLCSQVDLPGILAMLPLPLSQGVLLALLQQLACDIKNDTSQKLIWMRDVAVAINPTDPMIAMHVRPIFEQVYQILGHQCSLPTTTAADTSSIRLVMHVINSLLASCK